MARPWRIQFSDATYHVMSRGNSGQAIFVEEADRRDFLSRLGRVSDRFQVRVLAFCLMSNHYHLFLRTPQANLAGAMKWLNSTYSASFNRRLDRYGHLLQGRYKSVLVQDPSHWLRLSIYIHLNPVRAGLVKDPAQYEWSSFRDYVGLRVRFPWLAGTEVLAAYGEGVAAKRRYRAEAIQLSGKPPAFWEEFRSTVVLGSQEAMAALVKKYRPAGGGSGVPDFKRLRRQVMNLDAELTALAAAFGIGREDLLHHRRNFLPRQAAYYFLVEMRGIKVQDVAARMSVHGSTVSMGVKNVRERLAKDKKLSQLLNRLE